MKIQEYRVTLVVALLVLLVALAVFAAACRGGVEGITNFDTLVVEDVTIVDDLTVGGEVEFGDNDLAPLGYATGGEQLVTGTDTITDTLTVDHGLTSVTWAVCALGSDPDTDAGDAVICSVEVAGDEVTVKAWQDDYSAAANNTDVHWLVIGTP